MTADRYRYSGSKMDGRWMGRLRNELLRDVCDEHSVGMNDGWVDKVTHGEGVEG